MCRPPPIPAPKEIIGVTLARMRRMARALLRVEGRVLGWRSGVGDDGTDESSKAVSGVLDFLWHGSGWVTCGHCSFGGYSRDMMARWPFGKP